MVLNFHLNIYLHVISTNFETGLPRYEIRQCRDKKKTAIKSASTVLSGRFETLLCHWYDTMIIALL